MSKLYTLIWNRSHCRERSIFKQQSNYTNCQYLLNSIPQDCPHKPTLLLEPQWLIGWTMGVLLILCRGDRTQMLPFLAGPPILVFSLLPCVVNHNLPTTIESKLLVFSLECRRRDRGASGSEYHAFWCNQKYLYDLLSHYLFICFLSIVCSVVWSGHPLQYEGYVVQGGVLGEPLS